MEYLSLGKIIDSFGLDGTLKVYSTTDNGKLRYKKGAVVFLYNERDDSHIEKKVISYRSSGNIDYVKLEGIDNPEGAKLLKGFEIHTIKDMNDLKVGYYFYSDLMECNVIDQDNNVLGVVSKIEEFPAQLTLRVKRKNGKDFFVPFVKAFIKSVNVDKKEIHINLIEGMLWK